MRLLCLFASHACFPVRCPRLAGVEPLHCLLARAPFFAFSSHAPLSRHVASHARLPRLLPVSLCLILPSCSRVRCPVKLLMIPPVYVSPSSCSWDVSSSCVFSACSFASRLMFFPALRIFSCPSSAPALLEHSSSCMLAMCTRPRCARVSSCLMCLSPYATSAIDPCPVFPRHAALLIHASCPLCLLAHPSHLFLSGQYSLARSASFA